jgi:hypothetical protein
MDYRNTMAIDETRLDREWAGQASRYMEFAEHSAAASALVDELKDRLSVMEAEVADSIRNSSEKVTEGRIREAVLLDADVREATRKLNAAKKEYALVRGAVDAMEHRKKALENLVQLHLANYRSEPRATTDVRQGMENSQAKAVADRMQPRSRRTT